MNPLWKVYKNKVLKTLNPEYEEDTAEEVQNPQSSPYLFISQIRKAPQSRSGLWRHEVGRFRLLIIFESTRSSAVLPSVRREL